MSYAVLDDLLISDDDATGAFDLDRDLLSPEDLDEDFLADVLDLDFSQDWPSKFTSVNRKANIRNEAICC